MPSDRAITGMAKIAAALQALCERTVDMEPWRSSLKSGVKTGTAIQPVSE